MSIAEDVLTDLHERIGRTLDDLRHDLSKIRTGRANPAILEGIRVDYYGAPTPLNGVASINVADARLIVIKPWDRSIIQAIEKAIQQADIGINPQTDGEIVRLVFPPLTEERRKELSKSRQEQRRGTQDRNSQPAARCQGDAGRGRQGGRAAQGRRHQGHGEGAGRGRQRCRGRRRNRREAHQGSHGTLRSFLAAFIPFSG